MVKNCVFHILGGERQGKVFVILDIIYWFIIMHEAGRLEAKFYIVSCKGASCAFEIRSCSVRQNPRKDFEANYQFRAPGGAVEKGTRTLTLLSDETCLGCLNFWCLGFLSQDDKRQLSSRNCTESETRYVYLPFSPIFLKRFAFSDCCLLPKLGTSEQTKRRR